MWLRKFSSVFVNISKTKMNSNKCYFRHILDENKINITFLFRIKDAPRQFNLSRNPTESLENLFIRIAANVQKSINKALKKKKCDNSLVQVQVFDDMNNQIPTHYTCLELFNFQKPVKINIYDQTYDVVFNAPWVVSVNLPRSILAGFPVYPENFVTHYTDNQASLFNWYKGSPINEKGNEVSEIHIKWHLVGNSYSFTPAAQDIGMKLKLVCIPGNANTTGPAVETISKNVIEAGPGKCPFETRHLFTTSKLKGKSFRCVTYNILADLYCDSDFTRTVLHPYCPPYALQIDYRKQLIMKELIGYNADILCLQEVDCKIFNNYLQPHLQTEGLSGVFHKKGKEVAEGLACFFRKDRFNLLAEEKIVLAEALKTKTYLQDIMKAVNGNKQLQERLLDRSSTASAVYLQSKENNEIILVGNTHLYFHPDADHIRLIQGGIVINWLRDLRNNLINKFPDKRVSTIICGDFNSIPSCGIYQLYTTGVAPSSLPDWSSNADEVVHGLSLEQDIPLASACGTPPFTNFTAGFAECLDYIYYETTNIDIEQVIPLPSVEELQAHTALPSIVFPSDHIALISDLRFK